MTDAKPIRYKTNGSGRDMYIFANNGGFSVYDQKVVFDKPGTLQTEKGPTTSPFVRYIPSIDLVKPKMYIQDGSGRDTYI